MSHHRGCEWGRDDPGTHWLCGGTGAGAELIFPISPPPAVGKATHRVMSSGELATPLIISSTRGSRLCTLTEQHNTALVVVLVEAQVNQPGEHWTAGPTSMSVG